MRTLKLAPMITTAGLILSSCGAPDIEKDQGATVAASESGESDATAGEDHACGELAVPPAEYYDALLKEDFEAAGKGLSLASTAPVLYLDFDGETLRRGYSRGQSFILCSQTATVPPSGINAADQQKIVQKVQAYFDKAGAAIIVTTTKPLSGDFTTMMVGGSYGSLGCRDSRSILGVAPLDRGNANRNDIGFTFTSYVRNINTVADTIAHEAGHSYGLDHTRNQRDLMYASNTSQQEGFAVGQVGVGRVQDGPAVLRQVLGTKAPGSVAPVTPISGTVPQQPAMPTTPPTAQPTNPPNGPVVTQPAMPTTPSVPGIPNLPIDLADLPGLGSLAGLANLIPQLNPADILDISKLLPTLGGLVPGNGGLPGIDKILTVLGIAQGAPAPGQQPAAGPGGALGGLAGILNPQTVSTLGGLATLAGFGDIATAVGVIQGVVNTTGAMQPSSGKPSTSAALTEIPDLSTALELDKIADMPGLVTAFRGHTAVVNNNWTGETRDALISALKVAYAQALVKRTQP